MLRRSASSLLGPLLGIGVLGGGLWFLYLAFLKSVVILGILGGGMVLLAMGLLTRAHRTKVGPKA